MRVAVDLRCLLEPFESGVTVYTKAVVDELLLCPDVDLDLFYQARQRCEAIHQRYPEVRHVELSNTFFHLRSLFRFPVLPKGYFQVKPDLIWLPDRRPFYRTTIPVVMTVHDLVPEKFQSSLSLKGRLWHRLFSLRRLQTFCSGLLFPSLTVAHSVRSSLPWEVTYEGARLSKVAVKPKGVPSGDFVLSLAPLDPRKRLSWFFEMARRFPKVSFVAAGIKKKESRFARLAVPNLPNFFLLSSVSEEEKKWLLKNTRALIAVSEYEGFDLPVLEAVSVKTPVILSNIPVHQELYKQAVLVRTLDDLQGALYSALQGNGKVPQPRGVYTWKKTAQRSLLFFFRVLLHEDRKHGGDRHGHDHSHDA
jgi:glycosyltransferase involved in cell wall biosynthesis